MIRAAALALSAIWISAAPLGAQAPEEPTRVAPLRVSSAVAPETVTVGDRFRSVLQVVVPAGAVVEFSPVPVGDTLQPVDSVRVIPGRAGEPPTAAYTLVAWVAGAPLRSQVSVRVATADAGAATYLIPLRLPVVRSVLPVDSAEVRPRPARGVLQLSGAERSRPWLLLLIPFLIALALGVWVLLRKRRRETAEPQSPRERALAALGGIARDRDSARDAGALYPAVTRVLRRYLAELNAAWSSDLTTRELLARLERDGVSALHRDPLAALLHHADRVKFARYEPPAENIASFLADSRDWIEGYPPAVPTGRIEEAAA